MTLIARGTSSLSIVICRWQMTKGPSMEGFDCPNCGVSFSYISITNHACEICGYNIQKSVSTVKNQEEVERKIGETVSIIIDRHPWYRKAATICNIKHKFVRLDLSGKKIWVPNDWVESYDPN